MPVIYTAEDQIATCGTAARARLMPKFQAKGVAYPSQRLTMVVIKSTNELMLYAAAADSSYKYICTYPILAASGVLGPKLKEGDCQVPEVELNPPSEDDLIVHSVLHIRAGHSFNKAKIDDTTFVKLKGYVMPSGAYKGRWVEYFAASEREH